MARSDLDVPTGPQLHPQLGSQIDLLDARAFCDEVFCGGSRGGGKTVGLLFDYLAGVMEYGRGWKGVLFRRHFSEFDSIIDVTNYVFKKAYPKARFREGDYMWTFPNGATLILFPVEKDSDIDKFIGRDFQWCGFDELPQFPSPRPYLRMMGSIRASSKKVFCRVRSTGNPGGPGIGWIKRRFQIPDNPTEELAGINHVYQEFPDGSNRMFILSRYEENKAHQALDPRYRMRLNTAVEGDEQLRKAWIDADFSALFGQFFGMFDKRIHCVDPLDILPNGTVPAYWRVEGSLDYGENSPTAFGLWATNPEGVSYMVAEYYEAGGWVSEHAGGIKDLIVNCPYTKGRNPERVWADSQIFYTRASAQAASMNKMVSDVFRAEAGLKLKPSNKDRVSGWRLMKNLLAWKKDQNGELVRKPKLYYFPECSNFEFEMENAVYSETGNQEDMDSKCIDHQLDATRYYTMGSKKGHVQTKPEVVTGLEFSYQFNKLNNARRGIRGRKTAPVVTQRKLIMPDRMVA